MPEIGQTISHFRLVEKIGGGGMGVVYKAQDLHLDRFVALKMLPPEGIEDPELKRRFVQEAKAASALNHPNIVHIYDINSDAGLDFIAMEYVQGKTLHERIGGRGLGLKDTLRYAVQIADALARAHSSGIIHRDLKPSNIMVNEHGTVKILDFGLAKLMEKRQGVEFASTATTAVAEKPVTEKGIVVGTVAYMSPEQAEGKIVDQRSDIFSFGSLLYEMISGQKAFRGTNKISTLSAIIAKEPAPLEVAIPLDLDKTISRCLRKDPERRFQNMADLKIILEELKEESDSQNLVSITSVTSKVPKRLHFFNKASVLVMVLTAVALALTWLLFSFWSRRDSDLPFQIAPGGDLRLLVSSEGEVADPVISPDGKMLAFVAFREGHTDLFIGRSAGREHIRLTNDDAEEGMPNFSPDGEHIVYTRFGSETGLSELYIIPTLGSQAVHVMEHALDAAWSSDGKRLAFVLRRPGEGDALATSTTEGTDVSIVMRADAAYPFFRAPSWSPDGKSLVVTRSSGGSAGEIWLVPVDGASPRRLSNDPPGIYCDRAVFTPDGYSVVHESNRGGATNLWLISLDNGQLVRLTSGPGPDRLPSVAQDGSIAFVNARSRCGLVVHNLVSGKTREILAHSAYIWAPAFSPSGHELAFSRSEQDGSWHIWIVEIQGGAPRQLTSGALPEIYPRFTPDGAWVIYHTWSSEHDQIWRIPRTGGPPEAIMPADYGDVAYGDISPDGKYIVFARTEDKITRIYVAAIDNGETWRLMDLPSTVPRWSPNGQWIAFSQSRGYLDGIYVIKPDGTGMRKVSETGGWPVWWPDGRQIGYQNQGKEGSGEICVVPLEGGLPEVLHALSPRGLNNPFDVSPDGTLIASSSCTVLSSDIWLLEPKK